MGVSACGESRGLVLNGIGAGSIGNHPLGLVHGVCSGFIAPDGWRSCGMRVTVWACDGGRGLSVWLALERGVGIQAKSSTRGQAGRVRVTRALSVVEVRAVSAGGASDAQFAGAWCLRWCGVCAAHRRAHAGEFGVFGRVWPVRTSRLTSGLPGEMCENERFVTTN